MYGNVYVYHNLVQMALNLLESINSKAYNTQWRDVEMIYQISRGSKDCQQRANSI